MKRNVKIATVVFVCFAVLTTLAWGLPQILYTLPTSGNLTSATVTLSPTSISWGNMQGHLASIRPVTIENTGALPITNLHADYTLPTGYAGTLTWDLEGGSLSVGETRLGEFSFTLTDGPEDVPFAFDIIISGDA